MNPCKSSPCQNDAKCFSDVNNEEFYCKCTKGYEGKVCEKEGNVKSRNSLRETIENCILMSTRGNFAGFAEIRYSCKMN